MIDLCIGRAKAEAKAKKMNSSTLASLLPNHKFGFILQVGLAISELC